MKNAAISSAFKKMNMNHDIMTSYSTTLTKFHSKRFENENEVNDR